ncbi:MAG: hypothetical protein ACYSQZ_08480, partial [Planctomycetota bacterium]
IYPFTIHHMERGRHTGSDRLPPCNKATVFIEFDGGPQLGITTVKHQLFLHTKVTGLLAQFFRAIGLRKHGDPLVLNWNAIPGRKGYAKLGKRKHEDRWYPKVKEFLDPEDRPVQAATPPAQPAQPQYQQPMIGPGKKEDAPF